MQQALRDTVLLSDPARLRVRVDGKFFARGRERLTLRGVTYGPFAPDAHGVQIPDSNRHIFSCGVGQTYDHFNWMAAYQYSYGPTRHVDNGTLANGNYEFQGNAFTVSLGYNF